MTRPDEIGEVQQRALALPAGYLGGPADKLVMLALLQHAYLYLGNLEASPSLAQISSITGQGESTVRRALDRLRRRGFLRTLYDPGHSNLYQIDRTRLTTQAQWQDSPRRDNRCHVRVL